MISVKHLPVRVIKKNKTVGRPSKWEVTVSQILSNEIKKPKIQKIMRQIHTDLMLYRTGYALFGDKEQKILRKNKITP